MIHAEDDDIARWSDAEVVREGKTHGAYIAQARPSLVEEAAIRRALLLAERSGSALYVLHVAAGAGVEAIGEARARGLPVYGETLTPYLSFTQDALWEPERGLLFNNYPVLKTQADQDVLWAAVADDRLQVVSSDHSSITAADRMSKMGVSVEDLQCGQAGVEMRLPVLYSLGVDSGRLSLERLVELVVDEPGEADGVVSAQGGARGRLGRRRSALRPAGALDGRPCRSCTWRPTTTAGRVGSFRDDRGRCSCAARS